MYAHSRVDLPGRLSLLQSVGVKGQDTETGISYTKGRVEFGEGEGCGMVSEHERDRKVSSEGK